MYIYLLYMKCFQIHDVLTSQLCYLQNENIVFRDSSREHISYIYVRTRIFTVNKIDAIIQEIGH